MFDHYLETFSEISSQSVKNNCRDVISRRILTSRDIIKPALPLPFASYQMDFLVTSDQVISYMYSKTRAREIKRNTEAFGAPYPFLFTTDGKEKVLFRTGNTTKSSIGNLTFMVPGFAFYIGPDTSLTLWNFGFENKIFSEKQGNATLVELLFIMRLGEKINRHNYFDFFEELVVHFLFQMKNFQAIRQ